MHDRRQMVNRSPGLALARLSSEFEPYASQRGGSMVIRDAAEFVEYWRGVCHRTRRLVLLIPADRLEWAPAADRWTLGDLVRHLGAIERWMYGKNVQGRPSRYPGPGEELATGLDEVLGYLDRMHTESCAIFAGLSPKQLAGKSVTPAGTPITTYKWLRAMVEHEAHPRGQIQLLLGLLGVKTPQIFGLTEEEVRARSSSLGASALVPPSE